MLIVSPTFRYPERARRSAEETGHAHQTLPPERFPILSYFCDVETNSYGRFVGEYRHCVWEFLERRQERVEIVGIGDDRSVVLDGNQRIPYFWRAFSSNDEYRTTRLPN